MTADPMRSLSILIELGIPRVLTSGQERSVLEGIDLIKDLVAISAGRIIVMAGGGTYFITLIEPFLPILGFVFRNLDEDVP